MTRANVEQNLSECPAAVLEHPFGPDADVWKIGGKIFAIVGDGQDGRLQVSLKCDPELALELREEFPNHVTGGYHLNKKHWNTVIVDEHLPTYELSDWIGHSYELVVGLLPRSVRESLGVDVLPSGGPRQVAGA